MHTPTVFLAIPGIVMTILCWLGCRQLGDERVYVAPAGKPQAVFVSLPPVQGDAVVEGRYCPDLFRDCIWGTRPLTPRPSASFHESPLFERVEGFSNGAGAVGDDLAHVAQGQWLIRCLECFVGEGRDSAEFEEDRSQCVNLTGSPRSSIRCVPQRWGSVEFVDVGTNASVFLHAVDEWLGFVAQSCQDSADGGDVEAGC